jgi:hypothetical protein
MKKLVIILLLFLLLDCGNTIAQTLPTPQKSKPKLPQISELKLHTSASDREFEAFLGPPTERSLPKNLTKEAEQELRKMKIENLRWHNSGIVVCLRNGLAWEISVDKPFMGRFHGTRLGEHIQSVVTRKGNPSIQETHPTGASYLKEFKPGEVWKWKPDDNRIIFYDYSLGPHHQHCRLYFYLDSGGKIIGIQETNFTLKGNWILTPK